MSARIEAAPWAPAAGWAVLLGASQLATLRLIDVEPYAVFQHYRPWSLLGVHPGLVVLVLQTAVCALVGGRRLAALGRGALAALGPWRCAAAAGLVGFALAVPAESASRFAGELLLAGWVAAASLANVCLLADALPAAGLDRVRSWLDARLSLPGSPPRERPWDRALPWLAALWVAGVTALLARGVLDGVPHVDDSIAYLFQAKTYASGALSLPPPPDVDAFALTHMILDGHHWYSKFFPGWPVLLVPGVWAGVPWLVSPLLAGATLPLLHDLVRRVGDRGLANLAVALVAGSPWFLFLSASFMSHTAALFWVVVALLAIERLRGRSFGVGVVVAGVALGALFLTRPFDAALVGPVCGLWALGWFRPRLSLPSLVGIGLVAAGVAGLTFVWSATLTGSPTPLPHSLWADALWGPGVDAFGFGPRVGIPLWRNVDPLPGHGPADVVLNTNKNLFLTNFELFGWGFGSLLGVALALVLPGKRRGDALWWGLVAALVCGHFFYWSPGGPDFAARYWYAALPGFVVLTLRGAQQLAARGGARSPRLGLRIGAACTAASLVALVTVVPWRARTKYHRYREIGGEIRDIVRDAGIRKALVLVRSPVRADHQAAFNFNPAPLDAGPTVFARDAGPASRAALLRAYPDRPIWILERAQGDAPRLVLAAGPLPPGVDPGGEAPDSPRPLQADLR